MHCESVSPIVNPDSKEDPIVEVPGLTGSELLKKSQISGLDVRSMVVRCTTCRGQINHLDYHKVKRHRLLNVIVCKECFDFYGTEEFSRDENGNYNYCTWCGNGGTLFLCDLAKCPNVFCLNCVRRNFGRAEVAAMQKDGWKCYLCEQEKLKAKVSYCDLIVEYSRNRAKKEKKDKESEQFINKELISETWVIEAFNKTENACKSLQKKMNKLKHVEVSRTKSLKHIIKKMEEVVSKHKTELSGVLKSLSFRYDCYMKLKQAEVNQQNKNNSISNGSLSKPEKSSSPPPMICISDSDDMKLTIEAEEIKVSVNDCNDKMDLTSPTDNKKYTPADIKITNGDKLHVKKETIDEGILVNEQVNQNERNPTKLAEQKFVKIESVKNTTDMNIDQEMAAKMKLLRDSSEDSEVNSKSGSENDFKKVKSKESKSNSTLTVTAEVHSHELQSEIKTGNSLDNENHKTPPKIVNRTLNKSEYVIKNCAIKESSISSLSSDSGNSELESLTSSKKVKVSKKKLQQKTSKSKTVEIDYVNDPKLRLKTNVILERCDSMLKGEASVKVPAIYLLNEIDKKIKSLEKEPEMSKKCEKKPSTIKKPKSKTIAPKNVQHDSSSSIVFSSEEEGENVTTNKVKPIIKDDLESQAKKALLESSDSSSELNSSDSEIEIKKKSKKRNASKKVNSDSSLDFQPRKKKKFDKLLKERLISDDETSKDSKKSLSERKKKRKHATSDEDFQKDDKKSSKSDTTSQSESDGERKKSKKRKRIKKPAASSSENSADENKKDKTETPKKGRKEIKKIISKENLKQETKEAQQAERERKKRIEEKQKLYNVITESSKDGNEIVTKKLVLEIDPISKEEIVQIHPDLIEKLKPHQVEGVKFMWGCTIESLKDLEKGPGSGCILAHCMGLGKTLQCVTFLHTCLTNKEVKKKIKRAMVICPYNTLLNWSNEFEMWLSKVDTEEILLHEMTIVKDNFARLDILKYWYEDGGVLIVSYDIFRRMAGTKIPKLKKSQRDKVHECLLDPGPDIVICDEGHILKNETSAISKACAQIKTQRRIVLTGTPLQNNLKEYHCMLSFVKPNLLGTMKEFRNRFVNPIINGQYEDSDEYDVRRMKKRIHILHKLLDGCVQRCDYAALTQFLPPKHEYVISVKLSEVQIKMYRWYLDNMSKAKGQDKIQGGTLFQDYNTIRNLCTHPYIIHTSFQRTEQRKLMKDDDEDHDSFIASGSSSSEKNSSGGSDTDEIIKEYKTRSRRKSVEDVEESEQEEPEDKKEWYHEFISESDAHKAELSGKMVLLLSILKECQTIGDKVIVFSQSLLTLDLIEDVLQDVSNRESNDGYLWIPGLDYVRMDGGTSAECRKRFIDMFNNPDNVRARLFLVSTRAGGLGTNLVGANRVVMLDASWNPSHDVQAIFRVYRFGQKKPVYIYRLLAQGTMEEKIYDRQVTKLSLSIRVVDEQQIDRHFNAAELSELYTFNPDSQSNRPTPMVPNDRLLAEMLIKYKDLIVSYHEHDSLLQNETEEDLTEAERKAAWNEYENEREGRSLEDVSIEEEITKYCKEPDFNQADYDGPVLQSSKSMIDDLINQLRPKFPNASAVILRRKLLNALIQIKAVFIEKQTVILRMKQEFLARGSVPSTVNKYLAEINLTLTELTQHIGKVTNLVNSDAIAEQTARLQASQQQSYTPGVAPGYQARFPFMAQHPVNNVQFNNLVNMQYRNLKFQYRPAGPNSSIPNRTTFPPQNYYAAHQQPPKEFNKPTTHSQPVIIEVPPDDATPPAAEAQSSNSKSSVVIEEIE